MNFGSKFMNLLFHELTTSVAPGLERQGRQKLILGFGQSVWPPLRAVPDASRKASIRMDLGPVSVSDGGQTDWGSGVVGRSRASREGRWLAIFWAGGEVGLRIAEPPYANKEE